MSNPHFAQFTAPTSGEIVEPTHENDMSAPVTHSVYSPDIKEALRFCGSHDGKQEHDPQAYNVPLSALYSISALFGVSDHPYMELLKAKAAEGIHIAKQDTKQLSALSVFAVNFKHERGTQITDNMKDYLRLLSTAERTTKEPKRVQVRRFKDFSGLFKGLQDGLTTDKDSIRVNGELVARFDSYSNVVELTDFGASLGFERPPDSAGEIMLPHTLKLNVDAAKASISLSKSVTLTALVTTACDVARRATTLAGSDVDRVFRSSPENVEKFTYNDGHGRVFTDYKPALEPESLEFHINKLKSGTVDECRAFLTCCRDLRKNTRHDTKYSRFGVAEVAMKQVTAIDLLGMREGESLIVVGAGDSHITSLDLDATWPDNPVLLTDKESSLSHVVGEVDAKEAANYVGFDNAMSDALSLRNGKGASEMKDEEFAYQILEAMITAGVKRCAVKVHVWAANKNMCRLRPMMNGAKDTSTAYHFSVMLGGRDHNGEIFLILDNTREAVPYNPAALSLLFSRVANVGAVANYWRTVAGLSGTRRPPPVPESDVFSYSVDRVNKKFVQTGRTAARREELHYRCTLERIYHQFANHEGGGREEDEEIDEYADYTA